MLDLDQLLLEFAAPAFSKLGAPARRVGKLLRALLLLNVKNIRSEKFLVNTGENGYGLSAVTFTVGADGKAASVVVENLNKNGQGSFMRAPDIQRQLGPSR